MIHYNDEATNNPHFTDEDCGIFQVEHPSILMMLGTRFPHASRCAGSRGLSLVRREQKQFEDQE